jgi:hypothetical protein
MSDNPSHVREYAMTSFTESLFPRPLVKEKETKDTLWPICHWPL